LRTICSTITCTNINIPQNNTITHSTSNDITNTKLAELKQSNLGKKKKRAATLINLENIIQEVNEERLNPNDHSLISSSSVESSNTIIENDVSNNIHGKDNNIAKLIKEFQENKKSKTYRRNTISNSIEKNKENTIINNTSMVESSSNGSNYLSKKLDSHQTNIKPKQHYLFPKTPGKDEKNKFFFPDNNNTNNKVD